jgi:MerR family transcriptional regulator, thiopeptide resistance regulator
VDNTDRTRPSASASRASASRLPPALPTRDIETVDPTSCALEPDPASAHTLAGVTLQGKVWKIGELARDTGLTVRTLHHYDQLGLLSPLSRTEGGHRCYTGDDVCRLQRIVALRNLGISLEEIGALLDGEPDPVNLLRRQLDVVDERIRKAITVRARILDVLASRSMNAEPTVGQLLQLIGETAAMNEPNTPEQFSSLVLFTGHIDQARAFYRAVGLQLHYEDHGGGPAHYATDINGVHFALFDARDSRGHAPEWREAGSSFPGFYVTSLDGAVTALTALEAPVLVGHQVRDWGMPRRGRRPRRPSCRDQPA